MSELSVCLLGFGEVGQLFDANLQNATLTAWDVLFTDSKSTPSIAVRAANASTALNAEDSARHADLIISAVTAAETVSAARSVASTLKPGAWFFDLNSASPETKITGARIINDAGGRYVEGAVMSPVAPKRLATPILLGGSFAATFEPVAEDLGLTGASVLSSEYGKAAAAKMCRSVMVKGVEALLTESLVAARHYGVEDTVISSLDDLFPGPDWQALSTYMISRSLEHGKRRAEEMREAAKTIQDLNILPLMSIACAKRHEWTASRIRTITANTLSPLLDAILATIPLEGARKD